MSQRAACRPTVPHLHVAGQRRCGREGRSIRHDGVARRRVRMTHQSSDADVVPVLLDGFHAGDPPDIHHDGGGEQPELHQRDEAHAAGHDLRALAESVESISEGGGGYVVELTRIHVIPSLPESLPKPVSA